MQRHTGTVTIGTDLVVRRIGFGGMQLTGPQVWGPYPDHKRGIELLRSVVDQGVNYIDTADVYGPHANELMIREALYPYADDLVIATKGGSVRGGYDYSTVAWLGNPNYLRQSAQMSARRLGLEQIPVYFLHSGFATDAPFEAQVETLAEMREVGLIRHIGLSNITPEQFRIAREIVDIAIVTGLFNVGNRRDAAVYAQAVENEILFSPWHPLKLTDGGTNASLVAEVLAPIALRHEASVQQIALAWQLHRSELALPVPGTTSIAHLGENLAAANIILDPADVEAITDIVDEVG